MASTRQLAAIMFTDIVGYSAMMGEDEALTLDLVRKNRDIQQPLVAKHNGKWLKEMGDGTLISFSTASEAVYCALEIQEAIGVESGFQVRIGIHLGEIAMVDGDIYGDGVNIAARIEPLAEPGKIVVSHFVHSNIKNQEGIHSTFIKKVSVKNIDEPISIYGISRLATTAPSRRFNLKHLGMLFLAVFSLALGWYGFSEFATGDDPSEAVSLEEKSVVVLPFLDFSPEKDQEWFADGLTDELLNSLSRVPELRVIARTTSFALKGKDLSVQKIADSLNVNYLVEGSIQKVGNKIKVIAQLINPAVDDHIWSNTFEMEFVDIFDIQREIAEGIANTLNIYFDDEIRENMFSTGTQNADAYEAYLRGNNFFNLAHSPAGTVEDNFRNYLDTANMFYQEGIRLDPNFAAVFYKHQDLYVHHLIHFPKERWLENLTENKVVDIIRQDFSNARKLAKTRGEEIFYELEDATISNDWSAVPALLAELTSKEEYLKDMSRSGLGWTSGLLISIDQEAIGLKILELELLSDPLNRNTKNQVYNYLTAQNKLDSARTWHKKELSNSPDLMWELFHAPEKLADLQPLIESQPESLASFYADVLTKKIDPAELDRRTTGVSTDRQEFYGSLFYAAKGEQAKADSIISIIDGSLLGPSKLSDYLHLTAGKLFFNLAATPNFAARLKEAGITDLAAYEEKNRLRFK